MRCRLADFKILQSKNIITIEQLTV